MQTPRLFSWTALVVVCACLLPVSQAADRIPVVLATDLGDDIDDTWALAHVLRSPELDLKMVLTEYGRSRYRAALAAKLLEVAGRTDVAVAVGPMPAAGAAEDPATFNQALWLRDYDLAKYPGRVHEDGVGAFIELVLNSPSPVTVIAVGPAPSLAAAVTREPRVAERCRLVGMFGSIDVGYGGDAKPAAEWNVRADVTSVRAVFAASWREILLTPLDTCGTVDLRDDNYRAVWSATRDPLARAVIENYCLWAPRVPWMKCDFFATRSTTLFDCVAVYLAYDEALVGIDEVRFKITDDGFTVRDDAGPFRARAALRWKDRAAFEHHLTARLVPGH